MEALIKSLKESQELLDGLIKSAVEKETAMIAKLDAVIKQEAILKARTEAVALREDEVKKYGAVEEAHASLAKARGEVSVELKNAKDMTESLSKKIADLDAKKAELDKIVAIYKANTEKINDEWVKLDGERKAMKDKILEQLSKGLK